jgi:hypothetical protein
MPQDMVVTLKNIKGHIAARPDDFAAYADIFVEHNQSLVGGDSP